MNLISCIALCAVFTALCSCGPSDHSTDKPKTNSGFVINGKIDGLDSGWVWLLHNVGDSSIADSVRMHKGNFTFKGKVDEPRFYHLVTIENGEKEYNLNFFIDNSEIAITGKKDSISNTNISGSPTHDEYKLFQAGLKSIEAREIPLYKIYDSLATKRDKKRMDSLSKIFGKFEIEKKDYVRRYASQHASSTVAAYEVYDYYFIEPDPKELDSVYNKLSPVIMNSYYGKKIKEVLEKAKLTAIGNPAPLFIQSDLYGKDVALSSYRGKYLLIDFWASWCGPCREENPNIVKAYKKYHRRGFEIIGVSLDDKKDNWLEAVKKDHLSWTQVSDLKGWKNSAAEQYGILAIPTNFLLDKEGIILAKSLRGDDLNGKLDELLNAGKLAHVH